MFKLASWNVNSIRVRLPQVLDWLKSTAPHLLAIQETKIVDADFPISEIEQAGYKVVFSGQKAFNGMAILSLQPMVDVITDITGIEDPQRRILAVTLGDIRILNLYVPNGESLNSLKYQYKLQWLKNMTTFLRSELQRFPKLAVLGDFNIAPDVSDIHDPDAWQDKVLFSEPERTAFKQWLELGLTDCFRLFPQADNSYTWWDYRMNAFKRNLGARIDHILVSKPLASQCRQCLIDKSPRGWERPSDHTPILAEFSF